MLAILAVLSLLRKNLEKKEAAIAAPVDAPEKGGAK